MTDAADRVALRGDYITLAQAVKAVGLADTGGQAKVRVRSGDIRVNGSVDTAPGRKLRAGDRFGTSEREWTVSAGEKEAEGAEEDRFVFLRPLHYSAAYIFITC